MAIKWTPEELAEMAAADAEIDAQPLSMSEMRASRYRDRIARLGEMDVKAQKVAEYQRQYYEANRDKAAEYQRQYYEANRDKAAEYQRQYYERRKRQKAPQSAATELQGKANYTTSF